MRYKIEICYDGTNYCGWQLQPNKDTIEGEIEKAISKVLNRNIDVVGSGRTDSGVSALKQIAHFDFDGQLPSNFVEHCNAILPSDISIIKATLVDDNFHARYSAKKKTYQYCFYESSVKLPLYEKNAVQVKYKLNYDKMIEQIKLLIGEFDFSCFCASGTSVDEKTRTIYYANLNKDLDLYTFTICGNGFLYNMVRIIVGTIIDIGRGKITQSITQLLNDKKRENCGKTMPAKGLKLIDVCYD